MTIAVSLSARASVLDGLETFMVSGTGQATLTLYQTNTALAVFNLGASSTGTPFGSANLDSLALSSTLSAPVSNTGTAVVGKVNRLVITNQNAAEALSCTVGAVGSGADVEVPTLTVTAAATQRLNALVIRMAATGLLSVEASFTLQ